MDPFAISVGHTGREQFRDNTGYRLPPSLQAAVRSREPMKVACRGVGKPSPKPMGVGAADDLGDGDSRVTCPSRRWQRRGLISSLVLALS